MFGGWEEPSEHHDVIVIAPQDKALFHPEVEHPEAGLSSVLNRLSRQS
jgi:hypothetical protein